MIDMFSLLVYAVLIAINIPGVQSGSIWSWAAMLFIGSIAAATVIRMARR